MNQSNSSKQVLLSVIGVAILVVAVVGVSFAFFNYTRTGASNSITTGTIHFTSSQSQINVTNAFPMSKTTVQNTTLTSGQTNQNFSQATVTISGDTTYGDGLDFRITAQNVNKATSGSGTVPFSVLVTSAGTISGAETSSVGHSRITTHNYENGALVNGSVLAEGHIKGDGETVSETITIKTFIDADLVAITDTKEGEGIAADHGAETGYSDVEPYSNGTTTGWINGRARLTTAQWNYLKDHPASYQIRVEAINTNGAYAYNNDGTSRGTIPVPSNRS